MNLLDKAGKILRIIFSILPNYKLENIKIESSFNLVLFCGTNGINYLNASLFSIYKNWATIPKIIIVTDGTPVDLVRKKMIKWPKDVKIISWTECSNYYKEKGEFNLHKYASRDLWGKKLLAILYCAEKEDVLYSDTDVLWFKDPSNSITNISTMPFMKMCQDVEYCYSDDLNKELKDEKLFINAPLNAGVIFAKGSFEGYPHWEKLCKYLADYPDNRSEQTTFALLTNYFGNSWSKDELMLEVDDMNEIKLNLYKERYKKIYGRHYVSTKSWLFWRDYLLLIRFS